MLSCNVAYRLVLLLFLNYISEMKKEISSTIVFK